MSAYPGILRYMCVLVCDIHILNVSEIPPTLFSYNLQILKLMAYTSLSYKKCQRIQVQGLCLCMSGPGSGNEGFLSIIDINSV